MILIALGANLPSPAGGPQETLEAALTELEARGVHIAARSRWYRTAPVPVSDQPWFVNGVARVETALKPLALLGALQEVEQVFERRRSVPNAARTLDLDVIAYDNRLENTPELTLPHPRLQDRAFVLLPLAEVAPGWRHPILGQTVEALISALPAEQKAEPIGA
ncbi:MAG TPA: 2-amino-4-hydroxy-6-hydroxymethyldihydropteridine diphosphokinase [Stellaceae bacterium]|jgi:2-amino-4-hydroxy-6-hydroxymethyldihydropteridine diphosphokinase|nr:2-amino-4-hydroxy-6-hydroxymethyldihydropteridine diphosphokinase [Stellaceae bacterium]